MQPFRSIENIHLQGRGVVPQSSAPSNDRSHTLSVRRADLQQGSGGTHKFRARPDIEIAKLTSELRHKELTLAQKEVLLSRVMEERERALARVRVLERQTGVSPEPSLRSSAANSPLHTPVRGSSIGSPVGSPGSTVTGQHMGRLQAANQELSTANKTLRQQLAASQGALQQAFLQVEELQEKEALHKQVFTAARELQHTATTLTHEKARLCANLIRTEQEVDLIHRSNDYMLSMIKDLSGKLANLGDAVDTHPELKSMASEISQWYNEELEYRKDSPEDRIPASKSPAVMEKQSIAGLFPSQQVQTPGSAASCTVITLPAPPQKEGLQVTHT
ncbi:hypothetical protein WJX73_001603 [Symbiochloris irregularis]|uniref:Uncharacterized protein n=1 Tax=Symbiochloris irregularis TaxID=706552 RepID=A0AAW1NX80_9CHLO